jgi:hypothetical protein
VTVATFAAALTGSIVLPPPAPTAPTYLVCENCGRIRLILSISFLLFLVSLLSALSLKICHTLTKPQISKWVAQSLTGVSMTAFAAGFLVDGVSLIYNGQIAVGWLIVAVVVIFAGCGFLQVFVR